MIAKLPRISLWLAVAMLAYFALAVFGPKFGLIDWQTGFLTMVVGIGPIVMAVVALVALVALVLSLVRKPRGEWWKAAIALAIPVAIFAGLMSVRAKGESVPPIHDVATDTASPPQFSAETIAMREEFGANALSDYSVPLGEMEIWAERLEGQDLAGRSHAEIIAESYGELGPIAFAGDRAVAVAAVEAAMRDIGLSDIRTNTDAGRVEGVAETFAFGFKDDVVARIGEDHIDLRSVSRVGVSDLGYNAARVKRLSAAIAERLES